MSAKRLTDRAIIRLSALDPKEDVAGFLQGLVTNDVSGALPAYAGLLSAQGKCLFDFLVWRDGEDMLIDCEADAIEDLIKRLSLYRLRRKIAIGADEEWAVFWSRDEGEKDQFVPDPRLAALGWRSVGPIGDNERVGDDEWRAHRLRLGVTEGRAEMEDILWLETNAIELNGVSFEKGCYIGQENTARMNWRQKINRRLLVVPLDQSDPKRRTAAHEDLQLAVDHLRIDSIDPQSMPGWMRAKTDPIGSAD